jgi:nucleoside-diphosphate-sugar epimerase
MNVLVTGANGFLGTVLVNQLTACGDRVRALVRDPHRNGFALSTAAEISIGDLRDRDSLVRACSGVDMVFHTAALATHWSPRAEYLLHNVTGTSNLLAAMGSAGVPRIIHFSTYLVYGTRSGTRTEDDPCQTTGDGYIDSKIATEELIKREAGQRGISWTILRPANIYGPHDRNWMPMVACNLRRRRMRLFGRATYPAALVYVDDVAAFALECSRRIEACGEIFNVASPEQITWLRFFQTFAGYLDTSFPSLRIPYNFIHPLAGALEAGWRFAGITHPPPVTRFGVELLTSDLTCCTRKARERLGFTAGTAHERGLESTVRWMREAGLVS